MQKREFFGLPLIILIIIFWLVVVFFWGSASFSPTVNWAIAFLLFASTIALVYAGIKYKVGILVGLLVLAGLFMPISSLTAHPNYTQVNSFANVLGTLYFFMPSLALFTAALLLRAAVSHFRNWREGRKAGDIGPQPPPQRSGRTAAIFLALSIILLIKTLDSLYWLTVWDSANDSIGFFLLVVPVIAVLFSGLVLLITLPDKSKFAGGLYAALTLALLFAVFTLAQRVDFRQLTEARAGQVSQAIESYHAREGRYPQDLRQLVPWTALSIPGPVIIYGQEWCYQGGADYYRLGAITRDAWFSPILTGRIYAAKGQAPDVSHLCDGEMADLRQSYLDYPWEYSMNSE